MDPFDDLSGTAQEPLRAVYCCQACHCGSAHLRRARTPSRNLIGGLCGDKFAPDHLMHPVAELFRSGKRQEIQSATSASRSRALGHAKPVGFSGSPASLTGLG
jgi:hypothetical protein